MTLNLSDFQVFLSSNSNSSVILVYRLGARLYPISKVVESPYSIASTFGAGAFSITHNSSYLGPYLCTLDNIENLKQTNPELFI